VHCGFKVRYFTAADLIEVLYRGLADNTVGVPQTHYTDSQALVINGTQQNADILAAVYLDEELTNPINPASRIVGVRNATRRKARRDVSTLPQSSSAEKPSARCGCRRRR
jgi:hypothetical protein